MAEPDAAVLAPSITLETIVSVDLLRHVVFHWSTLRSLSALGQTCAAFHLATAAVHERGVTKADVDANEHVTALRWLLRHDSAHSIALAQADYFLGSCDDDMHVEQTMDEHLMAEGFQPRATWQEPPTDAQFNARCDYFAPWKPGFGPLKVTRTVRIFACDDSARLLLHGSVYDHILQVGAEADRQGACHSITVSLEGLTIGSSNYLPDWAAVDPCPCCTSYSVPATYSRAPICWDRSTCSPYAGPVLQAHSCTTFGALHLYGARAALTNHKDGVNSVEFNMHATPGFLLLIQHTPTHTPSTPDPPIELPFRFYPCAPVDITGSCAIIYEEEAAQWSSITSEIRMAYLEESDAAVRARRAGVLTQNPPGSGGYVCGVV